MIYSYITSPNSIYDELKNATCNHVDYALIGNMIISPIIIFVLIPVAISYYRNISGNSIFMSVYLFLYGIPIIWMLTIPKHCSDLMNTNMLGQVIFFQCLIGCFYIVGFVILGLTMLLFKLCYGQKLCSDTKNEELKEVLV